jgi:two-component system response regulator
MAVIGKILLVEDDRLDADLSMRALKTLPLDNEILWLNNGQAFIDYLKENGTEKIALVILDLKMPMLSGIETLEIIKAMDLPYFPIVVLTSAKDRSEIQKCYELGVNAFVSKPVGKDEFEEAVKTLGLFWGIINVLPE